MFTKCLTLREVKRNSMPNAQGVRNDVFFLKNYAKIDRFIEKELDSYLNR